MNASARPTGNRPLFIDFNLHTDGDEVFKKELITLMIDNLRELLSAQDHSQKKNDHSFFLKACHKMKSTLTMLDDKELLQVVHELSDPLLNFDGQKTGRIKKFTTLCEGIIKSLDKEQS